MTKIFAPVLLVFTLLGCADSPDQHRQIVSASPQPELSRTATTPPATAVASSLPVTAAVQPVASHGHPLTQPGKAEKEKKKTQPKAETSAPTKTKQPSKPKAVTCTLSKSGRDTYEVANIVCKNDTDMIHMVYLQILALGYSGIPTQVSERAGYLLAPGESKRVVRLKVISRPADLKMTYKAVPFSVAMTPK